MSSNTTNSNLRQRRGKTTTNDVTTENEVVASSSASASTSKITTASKQSVPSLSNTFLGIVHVYNIVWCLHYFTPLLDVMLYNYTKDVPFQPWKKTKFIIALDHRTLTVYDYVLLYPLVATIVYLYIKMYCFSKTDRSLQHKLFVIKCVFVAHIVDFVIRLIRMPLVWDHEQWAMLCNMIFVSSFFVPLFATHTTHTTSPQILQGLETATYWWLRQSTLLFGSLYIYAAFWKLTLSFVNNTSTSCGSSLVLETAATYYLPQTEVPFALAQFAVDAGPHLTFIVEALIGCTIMYIGLVNDFYTSAFFGPKKYSSTFIFIRNIGVIVTTLFHLMIYILPVNAAGGFSLDCMTRLLFMFHPLEVYHSLFVSETNIYTNKISRNRIWFVCLLVYVRYKGTGYPVDVGYFYYCLIFDLYIQMMYTNIPPAILTNTESSISVITNLLTYGTLIFSFVYGIFFTVLGLEQMGAPTMYSNLRYYYGGNHMIVPTGILGDDILYGGGLIQIVYSTCDPLTQKLGFIDSKDIVPEPLYKLQKSLLRNSSIPNSPIYSDYDIPMQFVPLCLTNPHSKELLIDYYRASNPIGTPAPFPFIFPINAVQRAINKAIHNGVISEESSFVIKFADGGKSSVLKQPPALIENVTNIVVLSYDYMEDVHRMMITCHVEKYNLNNTDITIDNDMASATTAKKESCDDYPLAQLFLNPKPAKWTDYFVSKILSPYPQIINEPDEVCMS